MTSTEKTNLQAAIAQLRNFFGGLAALALNEALIDIDAGTNASNLSSQEGYDSAFNVTVLPVVATGGAGVAHLPPNPRVNDEAIVTDSTVATNGGTVVGGGATRVMVRWNGTNWIIV